MRIERAGTSTLRTRVFPNPKAREVLQGRKSSRDELRHNEKTPVGKLISHFLPTERGLPVIRATEGSICPRPIRLECRCRHYASAGIHLRQSRLQLLGQRSERLAWLSTSGEGNVLILVG